jgi:hypothetical protein
VSDLDVDFVEEAMVQQLLDGSPRWTTNLPAAVLAWFTALSMPSTRLILYSDRGVRQRTSVHFSTAGLTTLLENEWIPVC